MLPRSAFRAVRASAPRQAIARTVVRGYAASTQDVKPPIAVYGLDGTYATALVRNSLNWLLAVSQACHGTFSVVN
jgi:hypothetical protein